MTPDQKADVISLRAKGFRIAFIATFLRLPEADVLAVVIADQARINAAHDARTDEARRDAMFEDRYAEEDL